MQNSSRKALEITTEIVAAKMHNETFAATADSDEDVAEFFKAIYLGVKEITDSIE